MIKVETLIKALEMLPNGCTCHAYEGEIVGLVITDSSGKELGYIETDDESGEFIKDWYNCRNQIILLTHTTATSVRTITTMNNKINPLNVNV